MKILVDNKIEELEIVDPKTGCNYEQDLIGNAGGFDGYDEDQELYTMTSEHFRWWYDYVFFEQDLQYIIYEIRNSLDDTDDFDRDVIEAGDGDYGTMQNNLIKVVREWKSK